MAVSTLVRVNADWPAGVRATTAKGVTLTTAMTNLATAYNIATDIVTVTTSGATGNTMALPKTGEAGDQIVIRNSTANALSLIPASAVGTIDALSAGAAYSIAANKNCSITCLGGDQWLAVLSA